LTETTHLDETYAASPVHLLGWRDNATQRRRLQQELFGLDQDVHQPEALRCIVDRLTFGGNIIETGTVSYHLAHARSQRAAQATSG